MYSFVDAKQAFGFVAVAKIHDTKASGSMSVNQVACDLSREVT